VTQPSLFNFDAHGGASVPKPPEDITARKHGGNPQSEDAFQRQAPHIGRDQGEIMAWLMARGDRGGTAKEYAHDAGRELNTISGRFSELKRDGKIVPTGERRDGCAVYRIGRG
jgi:hypothetical protein